MLARTASRAAGGGSVPATIYGADLSAQISSAMPPPLCPSYPEHENVPSAGRKRS
jgi:hypothetical protein